MADLSERSGSPRIEEQPSRLPHSIASSQSTGTARLYIEGIGLESECVG